MSGALSTDLKGIADIVKEKLGSQIAELIPQEVWDKMVESSVANLIEPSVFGSKLRPKDRAENKYNNIEQVGQKISVLQQIFENEAGKFLEAKINSAFDTPEWKQVFDGATGLWNPSVAVKEAVAVNSDLLMRSFIANQMAFTLQESLRNVATMMQNMRNGQSY